MYVNFDKSSKLKKVCCFIISLLIITSTIPYIDFTAYAEESNDGGFEISVNWGNSDDPYNYTWDSSSEEERTIRLKISYQNKKVTTGGFEPGEIVITVPGIGEANRSATLTAIDVAADPAGQGFNTHKWSYTYNEANDTYTFTNNYAIEDNTSFIGSFEILWSFASRDTIEGYTKEIQASLRAAGNISTKSNTITYNQTRTTDEYSLELSTTKYNIDETNYTVSGFFNADGLANEQYPEEDYIWVKYNVDCIKNNNARGLADSANYLMYLPEGAIIRGYSNGNRTIPLDGNAVNDCYKTGNTKEIDGKIYEEWNTNIYSSYYIAYPKETYKGTTVKNYVDMYGRFYEKDERELLAQSNIELNLDDYLFEDIWNRFITEGTDKIPYSAYFTYYNEKIGYGQDRYTDFARENYCETYGFINARNLRSGNREYSYKISSDLKVYKVPIYDIGNYHAEYADDFLDIELKDGTLRQLTDDEYRFTYITLPSTSYIYNQMRVSMASGKYNVKIYLRYAGEEALEFDTFSEEAQSRLWKTFTLGSEQKIELPENVVGVKILVCDLDQIFYNVNFELGVKFLCTDENVNVNGGYVYNDAYFKLYVDELDSEDNVIEHKWQNTATENNYIDYSGIDTYQRDIDTYGYAVRRVRNKLPIYERPNFYYNSTYLDKAQRVEDGYVLPATVSTGFSYQEGEEIEKFSMYTIIPEDLHLPIDVQDEYSFFDYVNISGLNCTSSYLKRHMTVEVDTNYKDSGRTYIAWHFDFSDNPFKGLVGNLTAGFNLELSYEDFLIRRTSTEGNTYRLYSISTVDDTGYSVRPSSYTAYDSGTVGDNSELWKDIDNDDNLDEYISSTSDAQTIVVQAIETYLEATKYVATEDFTNGIYVRPGLDEKTGTYNDDEIPYSELGGNYSYRISARFIEYLNSKVTHLMLCDNIEGVDSAEWRGEFVNVDCSYAEELTGKTPIVYYSSQDVVMDETHKPDVTDTSVWSTEKPETVRSIAIDFGEVEFDEKTTIYAIINMKAPLDEEKCYTLTKNKYYAYYDIVNIDTNEIAEADQSLVSNEVPVELFPMIGKLILTKVDETDNTAIEGVEFNVYSVEKENSAIELQQVEGAEKCSKDRIYTSYNNYYYDDWTFDEENGYYHSPVEQKGKGGSRSIMRTEEFVSTGDTVLQFDYMASSASGDYIYVMLYKDGVECNSIGNTYSSGRLVSSTNNTDWQTYKTIITTPGTYHLEVMYFKNSTLDGNDDTAYIRNIFIGEYSDFLPKDNRNNKVYSFSKMTIGSNTNYNWIKTGDNIYESDNKGISLSKGVMRTEDFIVSSSTDISFQYSTSTESNYDYLYVFLVNSDGLICNYDGTVSSRQGGSSYRLDSGSAKINGNGYLIQYSGNNDYKTYSTTVTTPGTYHLEFMYIKDSSSSQNNDKVYIKDLLINGNSIDMTLDVISPGIKNVNLIELPKPKKISYIGTYKTNAAGKIVVNQVTLGTYCFIESSTVKGYNQLSSRVYVTLDDTQTKEAKITVANSRKDGQVSLTKINSTNNNYRVYNAVFTLYDKDGNIIRDNIKTNSSGILSVSGLEWGEYYFKEKSAPAGYKINDEELHFTINAENDAGRELSLTMTDEPYGAKVKLIKYEILEDGTTQTTTPVDGAVYMLYKADGTNMGTYITDENGEIYVSGLIFGNYYFKETIEAEGYHINTSKINFEVNSSYTENPREVKTYDTRRTGSVFLQKTDDGANYVNGATYELYKYEKDEDGNEINTELIGEYITNQEGIITVDELWWGDYYFIETDAPEGYDVSDIKNYFVVNRHTVMSIIVKNVSDFRTKGTVQLIKTNEEGNLRLQGAVFNIYKTDGSLYKEGLVTDENGEILVSGIPWGSYYFLETEAPSGYGINPNKITFSINFINCNTTLELKVTDPVETKSITLTKKIKISDIVFAHGNPTFTFRLSGVTDAGNITYNRSVSFTKEYVEGYTESNPDEEYVSLSVLFVDIDAGVYTAEELNTSRYKLDYIEEGESLLNGVIKESKVEFDLRDNDNMTGKATFVNKKISQSGTSHSSQEINVIRKDKIITGIVARYTGSKVYTEEYFDRTYLDVYIQYDDGDLVLLEDDEYTLSQEVFETGIPATYTIEVSYKHNPNSSIVYTDTFDIRVEVPSPFLWVLFDENGAVTTDSSTAVEAAIIYYRGDSDIINIPTRVRGVWKYTGTKDSRRYYSSYWKFSDSDDIIPVTQIGLYEKEWLDAIGSTKETSFYDFYYDRPGNLLENRKNPSKIKDENGNVIGYNYKYLNIPEGVTDIADVAFKDCHVLGGTIKLPKSINKIGKMAFYSCNNLTSLELGENLEIIDNYAFYNCRELSGKLVIPNFVTYIGKYSFSGNNGVPNKFTSLVLGSSVEIIDDYAFYYCENLRGSIVIPDSTIKIGKYAFRECCDLYSLTLGKNLETIGEDAFAFCGRMNGNLVISASVKEIGNRAFMYCFQLDSLTFEKDNGENDELSIGDYAFNSCVYITGDIILPNRLTSLGENAFVDCTGINGKVYIPAGIDTVPKNAFKNCVSVTELEMADGITEIEDYAFFACRAIDTITIPSTVNSIGNYAFAIPDGNNSTPSYFLRNHYMWSGGSTRSDNYYYNTTSLTRSIVFNTCVNSETGELEGVSTIGDYAFYNQNSFTGNLAFLPNTITSMGFCAFGGCKQVTEITIPDDVLMDFSNAFASCPNLENINVSENHSLYSSVDGVLFNKDKTELILYPIARTDETYIIPDTVITIKSAFSGSKNIKSIVIPDSIEVIGDYAFYNCNNLSSVQFGENSNLLTIGDYAFYDNDAIVDMSIPNSIEVIGDYAFYNCDNLSSVQFGENSNLLTIGDYAFYSCNNLSSVQFGENSNLLTIGDYAFYDNDAIVEISIPDSLITIDRYAFAECSNLTLLQLSESSNIKTIGYGAFEWCRKLSEIFIPDSLETIDDYAFRYCSALTSSLWSENSNLKFIGNQAFYGCYSLSIDNFFLPSKIERIEFYAFCDCKELKAEVLVIPSSITYYDSYAFYGCTGIKSIVKG